MYSCFRHLSYIFGSLIDCLLQLHGGRYVCRNCAWSHSRPARRNCPGVKDRTDPCVHLGETIGMKNCPSCKGAVKIKIFACELHGQATMQKRVGGCACCLSCGDYQGVSE